MTCRAPTPVWADYAIRHVVLNPTAPWWALCRPLLLRGVSGLAFADHLAELLVDAPSASAGFGELRRLGEWLAKALAGMGDLAARPFDAAECFVLARLQAVQPVLQPGD